MKNPFLYLVLLFCFTIFTFSRCKKDKSSPNPTSQLPAATQEGRNTLGFLLNGQPWTPAGNNSFPNLSVYYDRTFQGGSFNITTYKQLSDSNKQTLAIGMDSLQNPGTYYLSSASNVKVYFNDRFKKCTYDSYVSLIFKKGTLIITKLDKINQVISGTFDFTLYNSGCGDTLKISEGRFDTKY